MVPYASGAVLAAYTSAFLAMQVLVQLIAAADHLFDSSMFLAALNGGPEVTDTGYAIIDTASVILMVVSFACWVCAVVAFAMWLHRAAMNLPALGAGQLRFGPGSAVGWWFVPLANLVVPLLVMVEVWRASDPRAGATDRAARSKLPVGVAIPFWWASWLALLVFSALGIVFGLAWTDQEKMVLFATGAVGSLATAICFALTIVVVRLVEARQARKHALLEAASRPGRGPTG